MIVGNKASLVQRVDFPVSGENVCEADKRGLGVARRSRDGGIVGHRYKTIPQSEIKDFCQPPLHKGALYAAEKEKDI